MGGIIKSAKEIAIMKEGGSILAKAVQAVLEKVEPGVTTDELDDFFVNEIKASGAEASFLGYRGYPKSICTSINSEVVHAIPGNHILNEGDIIGVDCGVRYKGFCTDMARTVPVGNISEETQSLINVTREALKVGIEQLKPGNTIGDVSAAIQNYVEANNFSVVRVLVGHGVGKEVHEEPAVPNYGEAGTGKKIKEGMVLALEPMVNVGESEVDFHDDGWTVTTADGKLSAHFEDTIAVTKNGHEILTVT